MITNDLFIKLGIICFFSAGVFLFIYKAIIIFKGISKKAKAKMKWRMRG